MCEQETSAKQHKPIGWLERVEGIRGVAKMCFELTVKMIGLPEDDTKCLENDGDTCAENMETTLIGLQRQMDTLHLQLTTLIEKF